LLEQAMDVNDRQSVEFLLWEDLKVFATRPEKSAAYLAAIRELVAEERFGGAAGEKFLAQYEQLAAAEPTDFAAVWTDPAAYLWVRTAYQLLGAHFGSLQPTSIAEIYRAHYGAATFGEAAARHLDQFQLFAAGLAIKTGGDMVFQEPLSCMLPLPIPGTHWSIDGAGAALLEGVRGGRLLVRSGSFDIRKCPVVQHGSRTFRMQASVFSLPGIGYGEPLQQAGPEYQQAHAQKLSEILSAIERYAPEQLEQFGAHVQMAVFKPAHLGEYSNVSHSELPGAFIVTKLEDPLIMADRFIHELHHNRLFCLEEQGGGFFDDERQDSLGDARFYSPWRDEPRPLHGLLHAFYVFQPVWHFWRRVRAEGNKPERTLAFAEDQLRRIPRQLALAGGVLLRHGIFTEFGQTIFDGMCRSAEQIRKLADALDPGDFPAWTINEQGATVRQRSRLTSALLTVGAAVAEHVQRYETRRGDGFPATAAGSPVQAAA
jgi:HEXXH motif-containing protein